MRGLKQPLMLVETENQMSHPEWVRGLKLVNHHKEHHRKEVAPRVGAWIETGYRIAIVRTKHVAPRVGAWIETVFVSNFLEVAQVAPRVGAWIETLVKNVFQYTPSVAPRVGAWIETSFQANRH